MAKAVPLPDPAELRARLAELHAGRGFLLPHHGALAAAAPDLHAAYHEMYAALTLTDRHLDAFEREFVWFCILVAGQEAVGTHHADLLLKSGATAGQVRVGLQLTGYAEASRSFAFVEQNWGSYFPGIAGRDSYLAGLSVLCGDVLPIETAHLALAAVHTVRRNPWGLEAHIRSIYDADGPVAPLIEEKLVEAMSLVMWPAGVNAFVAACTTWHGLASKAVLDILVRRGTMTGGLRPTD